jgi:hypothetical protein
LGAARVIDQPGPHCFCLEEAFKLSVTMEDSRADLSCYGRREYQTPNIDKLAAQGVLL